MPHTKPLLVALHQLTPGQAADCFVLLTEKSRNATRDGKPFYICRFRDSRRTVSSVVWSDSMLFNPCEREWQVGHFYKIRGTLRQSEQYGPQFELARIRPVQDSDTADGFDPALLVERSRFDSKEMFDELCELVSKEIADAPLRKLVMTLLAKYVEPLKRLPATQGKFYPFAG